ncbi:MAG TPA: hypothetical protein EYN92_06930 [Dehalococcoidia bacterium]|nr:hypothetical protein [Dehalococcoidia bacterium]
MSVSDSLEEEKLGVQIKVSPELIKSLLDKGLSPSKVLTRLIEMLSPEDLIYAYDSNPENFDLVLEKSSHKYNRMIADSKAMDFIASRNSELESSIFDEDRTDLEMDLDRWKDSEEYRKWKAGKKTRKPDEEKYINLEWESHYPDGTITDPKIKCPKCGVSSTKKNPTFPSPWNRCRVCVYWKEHQFDLYIQRLVDEAESENQLREPDDGMDETGYATLVALLVAYSEQPNPNPTSKQLIAARFENDYLTTLKDLYPNFTDIWREELRTSKARLTIEAKNMGFHTGPFRPSYGSGKKRKHPMYPSLHKQLREWFNPEELPGKTPLSDKEYLRKLNEFKQKRLRFKMKYGKNIHIPSSRLHRFEESD